MTKKYTLNSDSFIEKPLNHWHAGRIKSELAKCHYMNWEGNYNNINILDGKSWSIVVYSKKDEIINSGSNGWPNEFGAIMKIVYLIAEDIVYY